MDLQIPPLVDTHEPVLLDIHKEGEIRRHVPTPRPQEYYKVYENIIDTDRPLVFPHLPQAQTFVVTSSLMQILTARSLFYGIPSEDPHAHIAKVRAVCTSCVGRPDLNMDVIGLRLSPL